MNDVKRPLVYLLAALAAGILSCRAGCYRICLFILCFLIFILFIINCYQQFSIVYHSVIVHILKGAEGRIFLAALVVFFAVGYARADHQMRPGILDGSFDESASCLAYGIVDKIEHRTSSDAVLLKDVSVRIEEKDGGTVEEDCGRILVFIQDGTGIEPGNVVNVSGTLKKFIPASNYGQFNEKEYYGSKNIIYKLMADRIDITDRSVSLYHSVLYGIREKLSAVYKRILNPADSGIIHTMVLGDRSLLSGEIKELYQNAGISHILAISGLHISIAGLLFFRCLIRAGLPLRMSAVFSIFSVISYGIMSGSGVSVNRAVIMLILMLLARITGRTYDMITAAAAGALIILIQEPMQLFQCGFLLSFGAIAGICFIYPVLLNKTSGSRRAAGGKKLYQSILISSSIQLVTLPAVLYFYYELPLYGILINLLVLPLAALLLVNALVGGLAGIFILPAGQFLMGAVHVILKAYQYICTISVSLPFSRVLTGRPQAGQIFIYYLLLVLFIMYRRGTILKKLPHMGDKLILAAALCILCLPHWPDDLRITVLDVGQGDGIVIQTPSRMVMTIDGGSLDVNNVGKYRMEPFLKANGIGRIDCAVITHMDADHINGMIELLEDQEITVGHVALPDLHEKDEAYLALERTAGMAGAKLVYL